MSEREVKLTAREPGIASRHINSLRDLGWQGQPNTERLVTAVVDAAPDDATEELEDIVRAYMDIVGEDHERIAALRATPAGAALIRQAMDRPRD